MMDTRKSIKIINKIKCKNTKLKIKQIQQILLPSTKMTSGTTYVFALNRQD